MSQWISRVAVVTAVSSGVGSAIAKDLATVGMTVVGLTTSSKQLKDFKNTLPKEVSDNLHLSLCDLQSREEISKTFAQIEEKFGGTDVLVNNAMFRDFSFRIFEQKTFAKIRNTYDTNILGLTLCTREALESMKRRSVGGHIISINSFAESVARQKRKTLPSTRFAVNVLAEMYREENPGVKVTNIDTRFVAKGDADEPYLDTQDICQTVRFVLQTSPNVNAESVSLAQHLFAPRHGQSASFGDVGGIGAPPLQGNPSPWHQVQFIPGESSITLNKTPSHGRSINP
ncbi:farnesol dehydrogenase-like [Phlebotomus argentipes]|uniref:farnesol dehydrogenase-like n=1 Tax=Phlebotomus argentipes TaxID=94469 RepID=UPI002892C504|nr:farnesol dehydrogenase-like [Phlebotomus argentipes]